MTRRPLTPRQRAARVELSALTEAWMDGCAAYWERRARQLEDARPRPGDYPGQSDCAQVAARYDRLTAAAQACRARATGADGWAHDALAAAFADLATGTEAA